MAPAADHEPRGPGHEAARESHSAKGKRVRRRKPTEPAARETVPTSAVNAVGPQERRAMIAEAAYYRAERRRFEPGYELDDWIDAESEIERALTPRGGGSSGRCGD